MITNRTQNLTNLHKHTFEAKKKQFFAENILRVYWLSFSRTFDLSIAET